MASQVNSTKNLEKRERQKQKIRWLDRITNSVDMNLSKLWEIVEDKRSLVCNSPWGRKESDMI